MTPEEKANNCVLLASYTEEGRVLLHRHRIQHLIEQAIKEAQREAVEKTIAAVKKAYEDAPTYSQGYRRALEITPEKVLGE